MVFPLNVHDVPNLQDHQKSGGRFIEILVNLVVVSRFLTFLCLILVLFCSVLRFWIPFERKTKAFCRILKKLKVICLTWTGLCPKVKKEKKKHHKDRLSCICISWHSNSTKQTWETDQLPTQSEIKVFAVSPRRLLRLLIVSLRGCAGENQ